MNRTVDVRALVSHIVRGDGVDRCRICMGETSQGQVFLEDTVMLDGERPVTLAELLETLTGLEVYTEHLCPQAICHICVTSAIAAQHFKNLVHSSAQSWTDVLDTFDDISNNLRPNSKAICAAILGDKFTVHVLDDLNYKTNKENIFQFIHPSKVRKTKTYPSLIRSVKKPRVHKGGPASNCPDCEKQFPTPYHLNLHLRNSAQKEACPHCGLVCIRGQELKTHLEEGHDEKWHLCDECPLLFPDINEVKDHKRLSHISGTYTCIDCGRSFTRVATFEAHSQMHAVRTCRACGAQYDNRACYREHRSQCEPEAKPIIKSLPRSQRINIRDPATYICDYCTKTYTSRPQLKNHILWIHMNVRPHQCQWCGKRFYTAARLSEHSVVHTRERNFECDICGARLVSKMAVVYHRRRHTGEKPYECEDCGDAFISSSRRSEHAKRRHGKGERIKCPECVASFVRGHELRKHVQKVHTKKYAPVISILV